MANLLILTHMFVWQLFLYIFIQGMCGLTASQIRVFIVKLNSLVVSGLQQHIIKTTCWIQMQNHMRLSIFSYFSSIHFTRYCFFMFCISPKIKISLIEMNEKRNANKCIWVENAKWFRLLNNFVEQHGNK